MVLGLLWIFGSYAASIALVHWFYRRHRNEAREATHFLLITCNSQMQVEWYIRSLFFFSRLKGREIQVTLFDEGSTDDTLAIVERMRREYQVDISGFETAGSLEEWIEQHEDKQVIVVRLGQQEGLVTAYKMF
ncbi:hypothetical protein [Paenibacillus radicis (ex Xue et al. 2023)]|uniref:Glycosyltransferase n=1 Tax=Paenibacillus radicis (ex Xue et al. 2023) TaxID=2972489 RepID=A0ABT1YGN6_9BACL|nr:hypothetical protein [Paenibacillus radicis (ex Xue et al. 2023)]MCR8632359.1 hypothetical protein [Paenibacillus radicis (ex Xue et al. 2023)]